MFASELRGLLAAFEDVPDVQHEALLKLLVLKYIPAPETPFTAFQKLMPGMVLLVDEHGTEAHRYWHLPREGRADGDRCDRLLAGVGRAVAQRVATAERPP